MKKIIIPILALLLSSSVITAQEDGVVTTETAIEVKETIELNWESSYKEALQKAKKENKPLLVYFTGSDWCGPCIKLDKELFHTQEFKDFSDKNLVLYMANFPRNQDLVTESAKKSNEEIRTRFSVRKKFPTILMLNGDEQLLGSKKGFYMTEYYLPFFKDVLKKHF